MDARETLEYPNLYDYFIVQKNIFKILPVINREKKKASVSLSLLDWFVTNYVKKYQTTYLINKKVFDVHIEYKAQLTDYGKLYFDPFNRKGTFFKLQYGSTREEHIITTFKQLNFLRWALKNKIIKYVEEHLEEIKSDYQRVKTDKRKEKDTASGPKRRTLCVETPKKITVQHGKMVYKFK